ncbi:hypothetical protein Esti_001680 [Eimeria stiedai]
MTAAWGAMVRPRCLEIRRIPGGASFSQMGFGSSPAFTPKLSAVYLENSNSTRVCASVVVCASLGASLGAPISALPFACRAINSSSTRSRTFSSSSSLIFQRASLSRGGDIAARISRMPQVAAAPLAVACKARDAACLSKLESGGRLGLVEGGCKLCACVCVKSSRHERLRELLQQQQQSVAGDMRGRRVSRRKNLCQQQQQQQEEQEERQRLEVQRAQQELGLVLQKETAVLNLENIYLSWMRNALLATSCAMIAYSLNDWHSSISGTALLSIGGLCLLLGSVRVLLALPRIASQCERVRHLQQQRQQQQHFPGTQQHRRFSSNRPCGPAGVAGGPLVITQWFTHMAVPLQMVIITCVWVFWLVAASGVAGSLPPEAKTILSPFVFQRTLRFFSRNSSLAQNSIETRDREF